MFIMRQEEQIPVVEWRYEHRNNAQLLLPGLYLGSLQMSRSLPRLRAHHITHVIHACDSRGRALPASLANASTDNGNDNTIQANDAASIQLKVLDIYHQDNHTFAVFNEAVQFCRMAWAQHGNVLIYCLTGIDASAVIATAIVMNMTGMSHTDAMYWVKMRRRCADIRGTYLRLLQVNRQREKESISVDD
ncbi:protein-tyrosine phosphatase-like protein [Syncephalis plumigaleata]|nr:protein-tyrosine phosphatase-like protein [Syncephalis plumigaleata]